MPRKRGDLPPREDEEPLMPGDPSYYVPTPNPQASPHDWAPHAKSYGIKFRRSHFPEEFLGRENIENLPRMMSNLTRGTKVTGEQERKYPGPFNLRNWEIAEFGNPDPEGFGYNIGGITPINRTNAMAVQGPSMGRIRRGDPNDDDVSTIAHEALHGIQNMAYPSRQDYPEANELFYKGEHPRDSIDRDNEQAVESFMRDYWYDQPSEVRQKYADKFGAVLDEGTNYEGYRVSLPNRVRDPAHLRNYIAGEMAPFMLRGEQHPDFKSSFQRMENSVGDLVSQVGPGIESLLQRIKDAYTKEPEWSNYGNTNP